MNGRWHPKVFQVVECGGPGGTGNQVAAICGGLAGAVDTTLVYSARPGGTPQEYERLAAGAAAYRHIPDMRREISLPQDAIAWLKLARLFLTEKPDVVHAHSSKAGFLARTAAFFTGVPRIYYSPRGYAHQQSDRPALSRSLYRLLEASVSRIGEIVAVSRAEAALAAELAGEKRVRVIADAFLGDIPREPKAHREKKDVRVCAAGRLCYPRHPQAFARLAKTVSRQLPEARFLWIGDGELRPESDRLIRELDIGNILEITGWVPGEEAFRLISGCDVFVQYSRWEGLANSVLEAMAAGLPVVASRIPANAEALQDGKAGLLAESEARLARHVTSLCLDHAARAAYGRAGWTAVREKYSRARLIAELKSLYLESRPPCP